LLLSLEQPTAMRKLIAVVKCRFFIRKNVAAQLPWGNAARNRMLPYIHCARLN